MLRALVLATVASVATQGALAPEPTVLHIKASVVDADRRPIPVARHTLLISANPASAVPRRIVTSLDGTVDVRLIAGNYTVESDRPTAVNGQSYEWTQTIEVAGREMTLELTAGNAVVTAAGADTPTPASIAQPGASSLLTQWQHSVVGLWTDRAHASGFLVDARGLVATSRRAIGDATAVEVQITPAVKVGGTVLAADAARDVAVLWIDSAAVAGVRPIPLACEPAAQASAADQAGQAGQADEDELFAIEVPLGGPKRVTSGRILSSDAAGGPVFSAEGAVVGLTSPSDGDDRAHGDVRVVSAAAMCEVLAAATTRMAAARPPNAAHLPVESGRPLPVALVKAAAGVGLTLNPYRVSSSDFDILFITPLLRARAEGRQGWAGGANDESGLGALTEFGNWSDYVADGPPVLLVRVTPRLVEGLWMKVARGAAETQGVSVPPIKRFRPGFSSMRVSCGGRDVRPIHPFKIEHRVSETDAIDEGLYVFDPAAIGPHCGSVALELSSEKAPDKLETKVVDPAVIRRVWQDFAAISAQP